MKTIIVTFAYAPIIPLGFLISGVGLLFEYWVDKYLLLNRHSRPIRFGAYLSGVMSKLIPYAILIYSITNYVFIKELSEDQETIALIVLVSMIAYFVIPFDRMSKKCCKTEADMN
mmetsp:Transcript_32762/g.5959  ORF Transcript_32762/g.5959 Transcript_32762/m.5959 type:complete len:115 (+) Transcript_32762:1602-1946(+)